MGQALSKPWKKEQAQAGYVRFNPNNKNAALEILDDPARKGFKWRVWWVAASGFFTTSYCIFATNVVSPAMNFVYPLRGDCVTIKMQPFVVNLTTLVGTIVGMILFGRLADLRGRKKLYGLELIIVIVGTIGLVQSSTGCNSMNFYAWVGFWRFIQGIGLGAEITTIAAEWSSTETRGRMMASVFLMQSIGQITAYAVSLGVIMGLAPKLGLLDQVDNKDERQTELARAAVDVIWRVIISVGAVPALLAILLRRLLPETPRFLTEHRTVTAAMVEMEPFLNARTRPLPLEGPEPEPPVPGNFQTAETDHGGPIPAGHFSQDGMPATGLTSPTPGRNYHLSGNRSNDGLPPADHNSGPSHHNNLYCMGALTPGTAQINDGHGQESGHDHVRDAEEPDQYGSVRDDDESDRHEARKDDDERLSDTGIRHGIAKYLSDAYEYLSENSRWRAFLGVNITWFLLDLSVYGLGLDSPKTIATMYLASHAKELSCDQTWRADPSQPDITIYNMLVQNTLRNLQTITTGTLPGSLIILAAIDYVPRASWMGWTFVALAALFAITGGTLFVAYESDKHAMTLVFYVLTQLLNNLGPNTMTWILPAELFATRYRATFYGIAAASGKFGAVTIQVINTFSVSGKGQAPFAGMLLGLCPAMLLGAFITWVWVPEVQEPRAWGDRNNSSGGYEGRDGNHAAQARTVDARGSATRNSTAAQEVRRRRAQVKTFFESLILQNRTLEDIAKDPARHQVIGIRANFSRLCGADARSSNGDEYGTEFYHQSHHEMSGMRAPVSNPRISNGSDAADVALGGSSHPPS